MGEEVGVDGSPGYLSSRSPPVLGLPEVGGVEDGEDDELALLECHAMTRMTVLMSQKNSKGLETVYSLSVRVLVVPPAVLLATYA